EVGVKVADPGLAEIVGYALCEQPDLVREVEQVVIDRCGREKDQLFMLAVATAAAVELNKRVECEVAVGLVVAEIVALVDENNVGVPVGERVELRAADLFHPDNLGGDRGAGQFALPHVT